MAVLNLPTNNALDPDTLPKCTNNEKKYSDPAADRTDTSSWRHSTIDGGTVDWCGTLVRKDALWYVTSIGSSRNPNRTSTNVTRTLEATVTVTPTTTQPLNNPVWNYLYAGHTGSTCDQSLNNNISGALAHVRGGKPLPQPERPAQPVDGDRRRYRSTCRTTRRSVPRRA